MPYLPQERQYRSFAASNFQPVEQSSEGVEAPPYRVRGHYTIFNHEYALMPGYFERVMPTALDSCDMSDVIFQYDHTGMVLARQRNQSLRVGIDEEGGWCEATLDGCQQARDLYEAITNGLVDEMSFGFTIAPDGFEWDEDDDGNIHTRITKISKLYDVSAVGIPASDATEISARSLKDSVDEARKKLAEQRKAEEEAKVAEEPKIEEDIEPEVIEEREDQEVIEERESEEDIEKRAAEEAEEQRKAEEAEQARIAEEEHQLRMARLKRRARALSLN